MTMPSTLSEEMQTAAGFEAGQYASGALSFGLTPHAAIFAGICEAAQTGLVVPDVSQIEVGTPFFDGLVAGLNIPAAVSTEVFYV